MLKFLKFTFILLILTGNAFAGSDGELELSKKSDRVFELKDGILIEL